MTKITANRPTKSRISRNRLITHVRSSFFIYHHYLPVYCVILSTVYAQSMMFLPKYAYLIPV